MGGALALKLMNARRERGDLLDQFLRVFRTPLAAFFHHYRVEENTNRYEERENVHEAPAFRRGN